MRKSRLNSKVAIITGSSRGIGKALAIALAKLNVSVVLNGRNPEKLKTTTDELRALGYKVHSVPGDVGKYDDCENLVNQTIEKFGAIDILINNAGLAMEGSIANTAPEVFEKVFHTNILGVIYPTKAALPYLKKSKGSIIFTGSIAGYIGLPNYSAYSASKMALTALSQSLKIELVGTGVHVGINYVGFAENEPNKTFINQNGEEVEMPEQGRFKRMPLKVIASHFIKGLEKHRYKQTLSVLGKVIFIVHKYFPLMFEWLMTKKYRKKITKG